MFYCCSNLCSLGNQRLAYVLYTGQGVENYPRQPPSTEVAATFLIRLYNSKPAPPKAIVSTLTY
jgi:hypothetical protein